MTDETIPDYESDETILDHEPNNGPLLSYIRMRRGRDSGVWEYKASFSHRQWRETDFPVSMSFRAVKRALKVPANRGYAINSQGPYDLTELLDSPMFLFAAILAVVVVAHFVIKYW
jgi:hypothetical protein